MVRSLVLPCEGDESREGRGEKPTASQGEPRSPRRRCPFSVKIDVQPTDAARMFGLGERFELEVPLARNPLVGHQFPSTSLIACTTRVGAT